MNERCACKVCLIFVMVSFLSCKKTNNFLHRDAEILLLSTVSRCSIFYK